MEMMQRMNSLVENRVKNGKSVKEIEIEWEGQMILLDKLKKFLIDV